MNIARGWFTTTLLALSLAAPACSPDDSSEGGDDAFTSTTATLLDFEFDGEVIAADLLDAKQAVRSQLFFTVGQLNAKDSVGRIELAEVSITSRDASTIRYHAKLPVAWGSKTNLPTRYELILPRDLRNPGAFATRYRSKCAVPGDDGSHDYWFEYRPETAGCEFDSADVVRAKATVKRSSLNTQGRYPEYHRVWEDDRFESVAIFGKDREGNMGSDPGTSNFNEYIRRLRNELRGANITTTPANIGSAPGPNLRDVTIEATFPDGREVKATVFLLDAMRSPWSGFTTRYSSVTPTADFIAYNGHAGLGGNIQALAKMGKWNRDQYLLFFMNGCDTFAYVDGTLAKARGAGGADDPNGTKNLEFVTNAKPSYFSDNVDSTIGLFHGLLSTERPQSYEQMLEDLPQAGIVVVNGEEDNVFKPGMRVRP